MSNLNNTDVFGNLNVLNNNTINDILTVNGELYGVNRYVFSGYDEAIKHWEWYNMGTIPTQLTQNEDSWYITYSAGDWLGGLLSKKRFRREDGLTLEFEIYCNRTAQNYDIMFGFVDGNSTTYSYGQVPANLIYFSWPPNTYIFENGSNVFSENTINTPDTWKRFRIIMNNTGTLYQVLNGVVWTTIFSSLTNNSKYLRILLCCYQGNIRFRNMRVFQQSLCIGGNTGLIGGGVNNAGPTWYNDIEVYNIINNAAAYIFGTLTSAKTETGASSNGSGNRGVWGGYITSNNSRLGGIDYVNISINSNASSFGVLSVSRCQASGLSNGPYQRGIFCGGAGYNVIDYVTISAPSNATDFGDLTVNRHVSSTCSNNIGNRGLIIGANDPVLASIDYITITTIGNAANFGSLITARYCASASSNSTNNRGVVVCGSNGNGNFNSMEYLTITSLGNGTSFGTLGYSLYEPGTCSNGIWERMIIAGGSTSSYTSATSVSSYITINTPGNGDAFGSLTKAKRGLGCFSNSN